MSHGHQVQLLLTHPCSALLIPASLFFLGRASHLCLSPPFPPNSFLEPIFITHLTAAFPLLSPRLSCCRQASKNPGELLQFLPYILPHSICQTILLLSCKAVSPPSFSAEGGEQLPCGSLLTPSLTEPPCQGPADLGVGGYMHTLLAGKAGPVFTRDEPLGGKEWHFPGVR